MTYLIIIAIILSLVYLNWLVFALMYLPLSAWIARRPVGEVCLPPVEETDITPEAQPRPSAARRMKDFISIFFQSYYRYSVFQVGKIPSHHIRRFLYRNLYKVRMERDVVLYFGTEIRGSWNLSIGKGTVVGDNALLDARRVGITIGSNVNIGSNVSMYTGQHNYNDPYFRPTADNVGPITIGDRAWIGPNVTILHGVTIGEGAVIAAGAVVTKDIPPYTLAGGIPAKKIGERSHDLRYEFSEKGRLMFY